MPLLIVSFIFCAVLAVITLIFISKSKEHAKALKVLFLIAFAIHLAASVFVFYTNFQPFSGGRGDNIEYAANAQEVYDRITHGNFSLKGMALGHYYPVIVGYLYVITTTPSVLIGELFNAWLLALLVIAVYFTVLEVGASKKSAFIVGLIVSFYPSLSFFGGLLLKEALTSLLVTIALLMILKTIKKFSWINFFIFYIALLGMMHFRFYISLAMSISFVVCWPIFSNVKVGRRVVLWVVMTILIILLPNFSGGEGAGEHYFGYNIITQYLNPRTITDMRKIPNYEELILAGAKIETPEIEGAVQNSSEISNPVANKPVEPVLTTGSQSSVTIKTGFENPLIFIRNTAWSCISAVLGPFPWQLTEPQHFFILPEVIAWYFLLFFVIRGIVIFIKSRYKVIMPLVLFSILVFGVLGLFINNYGITVRIRIPAVLALLCLLPFGFEGLNIKKIRFIGYLDNYLSKYIV